MPRQGYAGCEAVTPQEGNLYGEGLKIWDVLVDGEHTHDLWVYIVDSGAVFDKGTTTVDSPTPFIILILWRFSR